MRKRNGLCSITFVLFQFLFEYFTVWAYICFLFISRKLAKVEKSKTITLHAKRCISDKRRFGVFYKDTKRHLLGVFLVSFFCSPVFQNKGINKERRLSITKAWCLLLLYFEMNLTSFASFCVTIACFTLTKAV